MTLRFNFNSTSIQKVNENGGITFSVVLPHGCQGTFDFVFIYAVWQHCFYSQLTNPTFPSSLDCTESFGIHFASRPWRPSDPFWNAPKQVTTWTAVWAEASTAPAAMVCGPPPTKALPPTSETIAAESSPWMKIPSPTCRLDLLSQTDEEEQSLPLRPPKEASASKVSIAAGKAPVNSLVPRLPLLLLLLQQPRITVKFQKNQSVARPSAEKHPLCLQLPSHFKQL